MNPDARTALLDYYDRERRDLPWRGESDPYRVLVSEVMLQQTRVQTVLGYYEPWLERFPDVDSLAVADEDEVLKAWEGLGYYRRARNLHAAAKAVRDGEGTVALYLNALSPDDVFRVTQQGDLRITEVTCENQSFSFIFFLNGYFDNC